MEPTYIEVLVRYTGYDQESFFKDLKILGLQVSVFKPEVPLKGSPPICIYSLKAPSGHTIDRYLRDRYEGCMVFNENSPFS